MRSIVLFLAFALLFNIATPHNLRDSDRSDVLTAHNAERIAFGLSGNLLTWNTDLANEASAWAENCVWGFSSGNYGQNLAFVTQTNNVFPTCGNQVQQQWTVQKSEWNCETNICSGQYCGSYTQMIWKDTSEIGCGVTTCPAGSIASEDTQFLVCFYSTEGNVETQHPLNCAGENTPPPPPATIPPPPKQPPPSSYNNAPKPPPTTYNDQPPPSYNNAPKQPPPTTYNNAPKQPPPTTYNNAPKPPPTNYNAPPKQSAPPPENYNSPPKYYNSPPPPPPSSGYYAVSDSATDTSSASGLTLGVWVGICIGCSALTALVVGLITYFLVSKRVDYSNRV